MNFDFGKSFQQGLEAADATAQTTLEINSIFEELNQQILRASNGCISITREQQKNELRTLASLFKDISNPPSMATTYIVASNTEAGKKEELGTWEISPTGYPCKLTYSDQIAYCNDKESLELQLAGMLTHPDIGKKMARLINQRPRPSRDNAPSP